MISSKGIYQTFCPLSPQIKEAFRHFQDLPLYQKIYTISVTLFAGIASFFICGLLAIPAFNWTVSLLRSNPPGSREASDQPEEIEEHIEPIPLDDVCLLVSVQNLQEGEWRQEHMQQACVLRACYDLMNTHTYRLQNFDFLGFCERVRTRFPSTASLIAHIESASFNELLRLSTYFVIGEEEFQLIDDVVERRNAQNGHRSFVRNARNGILDAWINRARLLFLS